MYKAWKRFGQWWLNAVVALTVGGLITAVIVALIRHVPIG